MWPLVTWGQCLLLTSWASVGRTAAPWLWQQGSSGKPRPEAHCAGGRLRGLPLVPAEAEAKGEGTWRIADREHDTLEERVVHLVKEMEMGDI